MESNNCLLFEMHMLNELRKLNPKQRKDIFDTLEKEEKLEEDALKQNPNLHIEKQIKQVMNELKDIRSELQFIKNTCNDNPTNPINSNNNMHVFNNLSELNTCLRTQMNDINDDKTSDCNECSFFSSSFDWWTIIIFILIFLTIFSIPTYKIRQCPIIV